MIVPSNIKIYFLPECEGCNICEPAVVNKTVDSFDCKNLDKYIITCEHYHACKRVSMHVSSQKLQGV